MSAIQRCYDIMLQGRRGAGDEEAVYRESGGRGSGLVFVDPYPRLEGASLLVQRRVMLSLSTGDITRSTRQGATGCATGGVRLEALIICER